MSEINAKDMLFEANEAESIDLSSAFEAVKNVNETEENGGNETMINHTENERSYNTPSMNAVTPEIPVTPSPVEDTYIPDSTSGFVNANRIDSDSAYRRIKILKGTLLNLKRDINATNCINMDPVLQNVYSEIERCFKDAITLETISVKDGESDLYF